MSTRWKSWSLQQAMIAAVITLSLIPALLIGAFTLFGHLRTIGEFENKSIQNAVSRLGTDVENHLNKAVQVMDMMVDPSSTEAATNRQALKWLGEPSTFEPTAFALSRLLDAVPKVYFGVEGSGNYFSVEHSAQEGYISLRSNTDVGTRDFRSEYAGDYSQMVHMEDRVSFEPRTQPWYQYADRVRRRVFTPVFSQEMRYAELLTSLVQPVYDDAGKLAGVFGVDLQLEALSSLLKKEKVSENGVAYIIDESGALIASSVYESIVTVNVDIVTRLNASHSANPVIRDSFLALLSAQAQEHTGATGIEKSPVQRMEAQDGQQLVVTTMPLARDLGVNWSLIVAAPASDFARTFNENLFTSTAIAAGLALFTALFATMLAFRLGKDFKRFASAARSLGEGRDLEFDATRFSEVRALQEVMQKSARQLKNYRLELKRQAIELEVTNLNLEMRVQTRTAQLEASRQAALAAAKAKSAFLATMSHEIRTPLNGVLGMATLLEETKMTSEQKDYLRTMQVSGDQLLNIINDILDFSKIESGKLELESEPLHLQGAVEEACEIAALKAREKNIPVTIAIDEDVPSWVMGDITRLRQVLLNFLNNAVKFTHEGSIQVQVRSLNSGSNLVEFRVLDTGIGISPDRQELLFQSFSQVDASTTRKYGGTGLGLAICKRLSETMGGEVGVESEEGKGSCFWFTARLPQVDAPASAEESAGGFGVADLKTRRALVVDDQQTNVTLLTRYLEQWGMSVTPFLSAHDALEYLKQETVDLVITDLNMPRVDGMEFIRRLHASCLSRQLETPKIIILASSVLAINRSEIDFDAKLLKPYRKNQLQEVVLQVLRPGSDATGYESKIESHEDRLVLVADDNAVNLKVATAMLRKLAYSVSTAVDGRQAVDMVAESLRPNGRHFALVLMDLNMPNMDGIEATRLIHKTFGKTAPPIVALTASVLEEDLKRSEEAGMVDFLPKPLELKTLSVILSRWAADVSTSYPPLAQSGLGRQSSGQPSDAPDEGSSIISGFASSGLNDSTFTEEVRQNIMHWGRLHEFAEFDDEDLSMTREVIAAFINDCPVRVEDMEKQLAAVNSAELSRAAHALKGAASNIGAAALYERCYTLEQSCLQGEWPEDAPKQVSRIGKIARRTCDALSEWLETGAESDDDTHYAPLHTD